LSATIIGIFYLHLFAANNLVGWLGGLLEKMSAPQFWLLHAAFAKKSPRRHESQCGQIDRFQQDGEWVLEEERKSGGGMRSGL
jgi:hypothetical protein